MNFPENLKYTQSHEWIETGKNKARVGVSEYAQKEISDVVFVELPPIAKEVQQGKAVAVLESVKAAFDIYSPATGKISAANTELESNPSLVNQSPYGDGWLFEVEITKPEELNNLMTSAQYAEWILKNPAH